jgi:hypothetical protein
LFWYCQKHRQDTFSRGAIISLDITLDGDYLIAAHRNGTIVIWELTSKTVLKVLDDFQLPANVHLPNNTAPGSITNVIQVLALPPPKQFTTTASGTQAAVVGVVVVVTILVTSPMIRIISHSSFCNTNGGLALVNIVRKFLIWTSDIKWVMNNAEKPILQMSLLLPLPPSRPLQPQLPSSIPNLVLGPQPGNNTAAMPTQTHIIVEDHTLVALAFEERTMIVALEPAAKVLGVVPREFTVPQAAAQAGLKFHPIIRPFGPVTTSWRASRPLTSVSTSGVGDSSTALDTLDADADKAPKNDSDSDDEDPLLSSSTTPLLSPTSQSDYTQVYDGNIKSYYTGTRPFQSTCQIQCWLSLEALSFNSLPPLIHMPFQTHIRDRSDATAGSGGGWSRSANKDRELLRHRHHHRS